MENLIRELCLYENEQEWFEFKENSSKYRFHQIKKLFKLKQKEKAYETHYNYKAIKSKLETKYIVAD